MGTHKELLDFLFFHGIITSSVTPILRQYIVYAMEDNVPTLRADINQLKRTQRLGQRKVSVTCIIREGFASPFQPLHTGMQAPPFWPHYNFQNFQVGSWPKPTWLLPPSTLRRAYSAHQQITATTKPFSAMELCIFGACCVILEKIAGTYEVVYLSVKKTVWWSDSSLFLQTINVSRTPKSGSVYVGIAGPCGKSYH